ncbi:DUF3618 domain-containing protein [Angustibacter sp. McL0619]|uniref:DUF3618 domain-containing protein n=1 Tax=Angustibacter sp. McL0619 TaxID=3415676 RepID=UPI003CE687F3
MSSNDPEQIRENIERTRADLSANVDRLTDEVNPKNVARRQVEKVTVRASSIKDTVMGTVSEGASSAGDGVSSAGSVVAGAASDAPAAVRSRTRGNPLAAGLIAFGLGALIASLAPATDVEAQVAAKAKDKAEPLKDEATAVAKDAAQNLKEPAQQAAQSVKNTATDAAQTVKAEGTSAAQDVRSDAQDAARDVKEQQQTERGGDVERGEV